FVVSLLGFHSDKFISLDDVRGQVVSIHTTCIETNSFLAASRFRRRPVTKQHHLFAIVDVVPGRSFIAFAIGSKSSESCQVTSCLRMQLYIWTQARMHYQMR